MHILVIPSWYRTKENPGNGSFFREQASALARRGHRVSVMALYGDAEGQNHTDKLSDGNLTEYFVHVRRLRFHLTFFSALFYMLRVIRREMRGDMPDIIHVHSFGMMRYVRPLSLCLHIPTVLTEHFSGFARGIIPERELKQAYRAYAQADRVLAVSAGLKESISPYCAKEIIVVPNMVHERFLAAPLHRRSEDCFRLITIGSLDENKGMRSVVRAFCAAAAKESRLTLTVCGSGEDRELLESMADEAGMHGRITFTGQISREQVTAELQKSQAFVLASRVETFGIVLIEAMAQGLPILMTKTGAWRELVREETGIAVEIGDEAALTEGMLRLAAEEEKYDPAAIRAYCREYFSEARVCARLETIYKELAGE